MKLKGSFWKPGPRERNRRLPSGASAACSPPAARPGPARARRHFPTFLKRVLPSSARPGATTPPPLSAGRRLCEINLSFPWLVTGKRGFYTPPSPRVKEGLPHGKCLCRAVWARGGLSSGGFPKGFAKRPASEHSKNCPPHKQQNLNTQTFLFWRRGEGDATDALLIFKFFFVE